MVTNTEMPVHKSYTHGISQDIKHLRPDGTFIGDAVKPRGCISWPVWPLRGINKTARGAKLILTTGWPTL